MKHDEDKRFTIGRGGRPGGRISMDLRKKDDGVQKRHKAKKGYIGEGKGRRKEGERIREEGE